MEKTYTFDIPYGMFKETLFYGELELAIKLTHRRSVYVKIGGEICILSVITAATPSTYYSGGRKYGRFIFSVPSDVRVIKREHQGESNAESYSKNNSLLRLGSFGLKSLGWDFYKITEFGDAQCSIELAEKLKNISFHGFGELAEDIFISNMFSENIREILPEFPYQTSGWSRNQVETHLYKITAINNVKTNVIFAANHSDISAISERLGNQVELIYLGMRKSSEIH